MSRRRNTERLRQGAQIAVIAAAMLCAGAYAWSPGPRRAGAAPAEPATAYDAAVADLRREVDVARRYADAQPGSWMRRSEVAARFFDLARLTGDLDAYESAERELERAFAQVTRGLGPILLRASLNGSLHRFDAARADLDRVHPQPWLGSASLSEAQSLRADIDLYAGRYDDALAGYHAALAVHRGHGTLSRLAYFHFRTGEVARADALYAEAERTLAARDARSRAWTELQRGLLDLERGRYRDALAHYRAADRAFSGWWLIEEHIAEIDAIEGRTAEAERRYRDLVARTGNPEFMDALGDVVGERDAAEGRRWHDRARREYESRLARYPEATAGHALGHYLRYGDAATALDLARRNHALRPGGEATTLLAQAFVKAGDISAARRTIESVLDSPWVSAETHATAAVVFTLAGDQQAAAEQRAVAATLNPDAVADLGWLQAR